jgi:hypothetical protein
MIGLDPNVIAQLGIGGLGMYFMYKIVQEQIIVLRSEISAEHKEIIDTIRRMAEKIL